MLKKWIYLVLAVMSCVVTACARRSMTTEAPTTTGATPPPTELVIATDRPSPTETANPVTTIPESTQSVSLDLSSDLVNRCARGDETDPELKEGDRAVEFTLLDVDGISYTLSERLKEKPVALIYGSFT